MSASDRKRHEYRSRLEAEATASDDHEDEQSEAEARENRLANQAQWVELQVQQAMRRGDFDNLAGTGKPIPDLDAPHDPDWWLKRLIERERITGVLPPALALRTEDARMDETLDRETTTEGVRRVIDDFNARIVEARRQLQGGPPVITRLRDADDEITAWQERRVARVARQKVVLEQIRRDEAATARSSWWRRLLSWLSPRRRRLV
ncbi:DUF1992 domain-containing protein [Aeromicrobium ginsengisoli]|uniref:DUF1992 domain-containing protein n=1 Tax=Aeromicrobium ginsengisoli TaxID=363867 RepID=A0A5M4FHD9_9ACTN|nr:DUF1992 domain-containing protein [Aeromicrobium ginsengisoli]KAA1399388.1 DUF1992 domain-containing protein [Aeromicrobium ginsengisoli]